MNSLEFEKRKRLCETLFVVFLCYLVNHRRDQIKLATPETNKLLESTKSKIIKNENGENVPHLQITTSSVNPV